jgi:hypothetical protein
MRAVAEAVDLVAGGALSGELHTHSAVVAWRSGHRRDAGRSSWDVLSGPKSDAEAMLTSRLVACRTVIAVKGSATGEIASPVTLSAIRTRRSGRPVAGGCRWIGGRRRLRCIGGGAPVR